MKTVTKRASVSTVNGLPISQLSGGKHETVFFDYDVDELQSGDSIPEKEQPDEDAIRSLVNAKRNAASRAKAQSDALEANGIEVDMSAKNPDVARARIVSALRAQGKTKEEAEALAATLL